jgi:threonine 3-dehydrogenase
VRAIAKVKPAPGVEIVDVEEPQVKPGEVKVRLKAASVCGTDLHIYSWDSWAANRIFPPRIIGHEFCGMIVEIGDGVDKSRLGQFVSSESHIVCGHCRQCLQGQAHVCVNTRILGVDVDGGFAEYVTLPAQNARTTDEAIPPEIAAFQDALGNAVHTVNDGPVLAQTILITGMGPIGLFAVGICKALGAAKVIVTEVSDYRIELARKMGADVILSPLTNDVRGAIQQEAPDGVDGTLEMSGHPAALQLAIDATRPGGRISLLGVYAQAEQLLDLNRIIFKGLKVQGIVGRKLWETWDQMHELLVNHELDVSAVVTHRMHFTEFQNAMELMKKGQAGKVVFFFD